MGAFETRNEVDEEVLRLVCKILAHFVGVISSTKAQDGIHSSSVCSFDGDL